MRTFSASALLATSLLLAACDSNGTRAVDGVTVDTLANGGIRVSSAATGAWLPGEEWRIRNDLTFGATDGNGPDVFGQIVALEVDQEGNIYVVDSMSNDVRVFGPTGEFLYRFGRDGTGPGEFQQPVAARWGPDGNFWVLDFSNRRWSIADPSGEFVRQVSRPLNFLQQPWPGGFDSSGRILDAVGNGILGATDTTYAAIDSLEITTAAPEVYEVRTANSSTSFGVPFAPRLMWKVDGEGTVWSGDGSTYRLVRRTPSGDTLTILQRAYTPQPIPSADRDGAVEQVQEWASRAGANFDVGRIPRNKPAYADFFIADDGHVWVVVEPDSGEDLTTYSRFDVFDPDGRFLGTAVSDTPILPFVAPVLRDDQIIAVTLDEMHVMYVVRLRIEK